MHPPPLWNEEERNTIIRLLHQAYQGDVVNAEAFAKKIVGDACKSLGFPLIDVTRKKFADALAKKKALTKGLADAEHECYESESILRQFEGGAEVQKVIQECAIG